MLTNHSKSGIVIMMENPWNHRICVTSVRMNLFHSGKSYMIRVDMVQMIKNTERPGVSDDTETVSERGIVHGASGRYSARRRQDVQELADRVDADVYEQYDLQRA